MELLKELMTARHTIAVALRDVSNGRFEVQQILVVETGSSISRKCYDFDVILKQIVAEQAEHIVTSEVNKLRCPQQASHNQIKNAASTRHFVKNQNKFETQLVELKDQNVSSIVNTITTGLVQDINKSIHKLSSSFDVTASNWSGGKRKCQETKGETKTNMVTIATVKFDNLKRDEAVKPKPENEAMDSIDTDLPATCNDLIQSTVSSAESTVSSEDDIHTADSQTQSRREDNLVNKDYSKNNENMHSMTTDVLASCNRDIHSLNTDILSDCNNIDGKNSISSADNITMTNPPSPQEDHVANEDYSESDNDDSDRDPDWQPPTATTAMEACSDMSQKSDKTKTNELSLADAETDASVSKSLEVSHATDISRASEMESDGNGKKPLVAGDLTECPEVLDMKTSKAESGKSQKEGTIGQDVEKSSYLPKETIMRDYYSRTFNEAKCFLCPEEPSFRGQNALGMHVFKKHSSAGPSGFWEISCIGKSCNKRFPFRRKRAQPFFQIGPLMRKLPYIYMHLYRTHDFGTRDYLNLKKCSAEGCNYLHILPNSMRDHFKNAHLEKVLASCDKCGAQVKDILLSIHKKSHCKANEACNDPKNRMPCPHCDKNFKSKEGLDSHIRIIHENRPAVYMCEVCSYTARNPDALDQHMFKAHDHNPKGLPVFQCEHCDFRATWEHAYRVHVRRTHNKQSKACEECGMTFKQPGAMKMHKETHSSKIYQCDQCTYSTKHKQYFQRHTRAQHKSHSFPCKYCPYKSGYSENTLKHMKSCARKHGVPGT